MPSTLPFFDQVRIYLNALVADRTAKLADAKTAGDAARVAAHQTELALLAEVRTALTALARA